MVASADLQLSTELNRLAIEYNVEAELLQQQLSPLGIAPGQLRPTSQKHLKAIAGAAAALGLRSCSPGAFLAALSHLCLQLGHAQLEKDQAVEHIRWLAARQAAAVQLLAELQDLLATLQLEAAAAEEQTADHVAKAALCQAKEQQCRARLMQLQQQLQAAGYRPELRPSLLNAREARREAQAAQVAKLRTQLAQYRDLPPNLAAAREQFHARLRRLHASRNELEESLAQL